MELTGYLAVAKRWWWTLLIATWVAAMAGLLVASRITPTYESQVQLLVGPINTDADTLKASGQLVQTYAQLAVSTPLLKSTAQEIPGLDAARLASGVRTTASDVTRVLQIRVQDSDPNRAAQIANTMADELIQITTGATTRPEGQLEVISAAVPGAAPIAPQVSLIVLLAMAAGLIGGLVLVIVVEYATDMIRDDGDLERLSETETLGSIAFDQRTPAVSPLPIAAATAPGASNSIAFRMLASKVAFGDSGDPSRSVVITAVNEGDSAVAATGLAAAIAASGYRVVVVDGSADADVTTSLRLERRPGLAEAIASGSVDPDSLASGPAGIRVLPRGLVGPVDLIPVDKARATLAALLETHDIVIVDGGPAQRSAGALTWARIADRTILLARKGVARRRDLRDAVDSLRYVNAELSGTIIVRRVADRRLARGGSRTASDRVAAPVPGADLSFHEPSPEMAASLERRLAPQPPLVLEPQLVAAPVPEPRSAERGDVAPPPQPKRVERPPSLDDLPIGTLGAERTAASTPRSRAAGPSATSPVDGSGAASGAPSPRPAAARASRRSAGEPAPGDPTRSGSDSPAPAPATARRGRATSGRAGVDRTDGLDGPAVARGAATGARRSRDEG